MLPRLRSRGSFLYCASVFVGRAGIGAGDVNSISHPVQNHKTVMKSTACRFSLSAPASTHPREFFCAAQRFYRERRDWCRRQELHITSGMKNDRDEINCLPVFFVCSPVAVQPREFLSCASVFVGSAGIGIHDVNSMAHPVQNQKTVMKYSACRFSLHAPVAAQPWEFFVLRIGFRPERRDWYTRREFHGTPGAKPKDCDENTLRAGFLCMLP
jgi:hypothetical protein